MQQMTVNELAEHLKNGIAPIIIDVREPDEYEFVHLDGAVLKPLGGIYRWARELDKDKAYVLQCHTGARSFQAAHMLERMGFKQVANLVGGIDEWAAQVDPAMPRY
jgi:rhodanese-related sulfurtransferase